MADSSDKPIVGRRSIGQFFAAAGVVLSLLFVGWEIRQNTVAARSATQLAIHEGSIQANVNVMNNERLRNLLVLTRNDRDWAATAPRDADYLLVQRFYMNRFNNLENGYYHFLEGTYDPRLWAGQAGWIGLNAAEPLMKHFWLDLRDAFMPEFQAYMDSTFVGRVRRRTPGPMTDPMTRLNAALEGRYRVEREIGEGGMATVYLAEDLRHERKVALKVLKPELAAVVGAERFLAEIKTTANLQHPHILPLFDSGQAESFLYYVMPYVEGESLHERLDRDHQLPVDEAVGIATNVAEALDYAHSQGVIHRDIKPANVRLVSNLAAELSGDRRSALVEP